MGTEASHKMGRSRSTRGNGRRGTMRCIGSAVRMASGKRTREGFEK